MLCCLFAACALQLRGGEVIKTVVIDPGHGGKDPGTMSGKYMEKDIVLAVGLRLGELIREHYPSVKVIFTRKTDVFIPLYERGEIANKASADLFMSIHVNGVTSPSACGTETFIMGTDKSEGNLSVAMRENDVITYETDYSSRYQGYTPGSAESFIMFSLMQYSYRTQSLALATLVQQQYNKNIRLRDRGVRQAGFLVLWRTAMPSILTELGFITNPDDQKLLLSPAGQEQYARSLFNAFSAYKAKTDGGGELIVLSGDVARETAKGDLPAAAPSASGMGASVPAAVLSPSAVPGITFAVQIAASPKRVSVNDACFEIYRGKVSERCINGMYKYYVCECATYREASATLPEVRRTVKDAFVAAFRDGKPIPLAEARKLVNE